MPSPSAEATPGTLNRQADSLCETINRSGNLDKSPVPDLRHLHRAPPRWFFLCPASRAHLGSLNTTEARGGREGCAYQRGKQQELIIPARASEYWAVRVEIQRERQEEQRCARDVLQGSHRQRTR